VVPFRCVQCGTDCVAHDGRTPDPAKGPVDEDDNVSGELLRFSDFALPMPKGRAALRKKEAVADYVVQFPDRRSCTRPGTGGNLELGVLSYRPPMPRFAWECAIVICARSNHFVQNRSWLYTAVTRASQTCVLRATSGPMLRAAEKVVVTSASRY